MHTPRTRALLLTGLLSISSALGMGGPDGVELRCSRGPGAEDVSLQWTGGSAPFAVFRSDSPLDLTAPANHLGGTTGASWLDSPPPGSLHFYLVQGMCDFSPPEVCDGLDNDCDPGTPDGAEDPQMGTPCDGTDGDLCVEGTWTCGGGTPLCSDTTSTTVEQCAGNGVDEDCDGSVDEDFVRNDNPACSPPFFMGSMSGDVGTGVLTDSFYNEEWNRFTLREDNDGSVYLSATIQLYSPPGTDYDLYVRCTSCAGGVVASSTVGGTSGHFDTVHVRANDQIFVDDTFDVVVEIRHASSNVCAYWQLTVNGNTTVSTVTCN